MLPTFNFGDTIINQSNYGVTKLYSKKLTTFIKILLKKGMFLNQKNIDTVVQLIILDIKGCWMELLCVNNTGLGNVNYHAIESRGRGDYYVDNISLSYPQTDTLITPVYANKGYRYGYQGSERDDEVSGKGNSYTAEFWQYSPRLGRRWNIDPVVKFHESPYACFANNPIWFIDPNGADTSGFQNTVDNAGLNVAVEIANKSKEFSDFFKSIASPTGSNFDVKVEFKAVTGLKSADTGAKILGQARLMYNNTWVTDITTIPADAKIEEFSILVEFDDNILSGISGQGKIDYDNALKAVTLVHELMVHTNTAIGFINSNRIKGAGGETTGINTAIFGAYKTHIENDSDHKAMKAGKAMLYNKTSSEIIQYYKTTRVISQFKIPPSPKDDADFYSTRKDWSQSEKYSNRYLLFYEIMDSLFGLDKIGK